MKIELVKKGEWYYIKTETHLESIPRSRSETPLEYTNRAFKAFDEYVSRKQQLKQSTEEEIIKSVNI